MQHCRTITLTDEPEETDAFSGPHQRIAGAVAQLIQPEDAKGISIGIEGSWGSGKSTVARLLTKQLERDDNITIVSFDAWAHEGDPLRRTFLETIIRKLQERKWVDEKTWDECIEELANRREVVTTKDKLTITPAGRLIAFILLLVPIGGAFITAALREDITLVPGTPAWKFLIYISIGVVLTFIPLVVLFRKIKREPDIVAFLFNKGPTEKTTETSKTVNPTSIEFEDSFKKLFKEALEDDPQSKEPPIKDKRRVVLILDNLDRVDSKDALIIWSTLQTFLQHRGPSRPDWHERLWLLVLYDIDGLSKLWSANNKNEAATSFIDKSFQIRFEVPALVLSDWRQFLMTQLVKAFPDHTEADFHDVYRILAIWIAQKRHLTIRELKLFVNQIGSVHRQWAGSDPGSDTFSLALSAYYALLRRDGASIVTSLFDSEFPEKEYQEILGNTVRENLAALAFNVEVDVAQQLLFGEKIKDALTLGEKDELTHVASLLRRGFWEVFEEVAKKWASTESVKLADAALAMEQSGILRTGFRPSVRSVTQFFCDRAGSVEAWFPLDAKRAEGIALLLKWKQEVKSPEKHHERFIDAISRALSLGLTHVDSKLSAKEWLSSLSVALHGLEPAAQQRSFKTIVDTLVRLQFVGYIPPYHVEMILEVLCELHERPEIASVVEKHIRELVETRRIAAQLLRDTPHSAASLAWLIYVLIRYSSTYDDLPFKTESKSKVVDILSTNQLPQSFVSILARYRDTTLLFSVSGAVPELEPLIIDSLRIVIEKDYASELFLTDDALERLELVSRRLNREEEEVRMVKLISEVSRQVNVTDELTAKSFASSNANLYLLVLKAGGQNQQEFISWCVDGLRSVDVETWTSELYHQDRLLAMAFYLSDFGVAVDLGEQYFQALSRSLTFPNWQFVDDGHTNPAALIGPWGTTYREAFLDALEKRIRSDDVLPDWFFTVFGLELKTQLLDSSRGARVVELLPLILKHENLGGLIWLRDNLREAVKSLHSQYSNTTAWTELRNAVRHALITQQPETETLSNSIANILNINAPKNGLIAFGTREGYKICTLDPSSQEIKVLIEGALPDYGLVVQPRWSPDGKKIAYVGMSQPSGQSEIFILDYHSGSKIKVTDPLKRSRQPSWSPDGQMLAFVEVNGPYSDIMTINLETGEERRLTDSKDINERPDWSPDGTMLVYHRIRNNSPTVFVMNADGSDKKALTVEIDDSDPAWSPDGKQIAFALLHENVNESGIYLANREGDVWEQLVQENNARAPAWSPDGTKLLYQVGMGADARIFLVDINGKNKKELTIGVNPTWQPVFDRESNGSSTPDSST